MEEDKRGSPMSQVLQVAASSESQGLARARDSTDSGVKLEEFRLSFETL